MKPLPELGSFAGCHIPAAAEPDQGAPTPPRSHLLKGSSLLAVHPFRAAPLSPQCPCHVRVLLSGWGSPTPAMASRGSPTAMLSQGSVLRDQRQVPRGHCHKGRCPGFGVSGFVVAGVVVTPSKLRSVLGEQGTNLSSNLTPVSLSHIGSAHHAPSGRAAALGAAGGDEELLG